MDDAAMGLKLPDFNAAFRDGTEYETEGLGKFTVTVRKVGSLRLRSGRIVACDPLVFPEWSPFSKKVAAGRYPVYASIAMFGSGKETDERIVCAMLRFGQRVPTRWEMALQPTQKAKNLKEDEFFGYPVDAGVGCFMDATTAKALRNETDKDEDHYELIIDAMNENYVHTRDWVDFAVGGDRDQNIVVFSSGMGDGSYPSYWGYDRDGGLARLVTDFQILPLAAGS